MKKLSLKHNVFGLFAELEGMKKVKGVRYMMMKGDQALDVEYGLSYDFSSPLNSSHSLTSQWIK